MCLYLSGCGCGIPKPVRRGCSLDRSRHGRMVSGRPCCGGRKPKAGKQATTCSLEVVLGWNTSSWRSWVRRLGDTVRGILCAGVAAPRVTLATPRCSVSSGGGDGAVSARPCNMRWRSGAPPSWALFVCLRRRGRGVGGGAGVFTHLEVWAPNMYPAEAEPLPPAAFHPPVCPADLSTPPPPDPGPLEGGVLPGSEESRVPPEPPPPLRPPCALRPPNPWESLTSLPSTPVTVPGPISPGGGGDRSGSLQWGSPPSP